LLYSKIEDVVEPFDSRLFTGGRPTFATFTTDNKLAWFTGPNLQATIDTADIEIDSNTRTFVNEARVITDAPRDQFTLADGVSAYHGDTITFSSANSANRAGVVPFRSDGRLHKFRLTINEGAVWSIASAVNAHGLGSGEQ
jgi:hypothetical protein